MKQRRVALHLAWIGLLFTVVAGVTATTGSPTRATEGVLVSAPAAPAADAPAVDPSSGEPPASEEFTPVACKMEPQCSVNADCVAWCGPTGGHCVHSSCPIRICKCS